MPVIYFTDQLNALHERISAAYPNNVIILKNDVMAYALGASARAIDQVQCPGQRPRDRMTLAATSVQTVVDRLCAAGLSVSVCDLDEQGLI